MVDGIGRIVETHVKELQEEIQRQQAAEAVQLGNLEADLAGVRARLQAQEEHLGDSVKNRLYQRESAMRAIEERDTPQPAGRDGVEREGYQHGNPGELAGRGPLTWIVLLAVLCLAMLADIIAFREVVERVLNRSSVFPMVAALTAVTTFIAHQAGELFKASQETIWRLPRAVGGWMLAAVWTATGVAMFVFRLRAPAPVDGDPGDLFTSAGTFDAAGSADASPGLNAVLLLFLYILTGAVAISAGYQRPRKEIGQYRRANRALRRLWPGLVGSRGDIADADALHEQLTQLKVTRWELYDVERQRGHDAVRRLITEMSMRIHHPRHRR